MAEGPDLGRTAYEARVADHGPREFDPWNSLTPAVKAIWARVEAASRVGGAVYTGDTRQLHADLLMAADKLARMAAHAKTLGPKGAVWVESADLLIALYRNAAVALATAERDSSEYADAMDARMADAITMERIGSALAAFARMHAMAPPEGVRLSGWHPAITAARTALKDAGLQRLLDRSPGSARDAGLKEQGGGSAA
ncbi:hypothetical protein ABIE45_005662 [Methylobacterium sp. OAE515]|uniref:hypothetical protein n=1 Tax=Methylobacterium sp. OAE515 TaxID=2817895 RepID=UPI00178B1A30